MLLTAYMMTPIVRSVGSSERTTSLVQPSSLTYVTGTYCDGSVPASSCASSSCRSNASTLPMLK